MRGRIRARVRALLDVEPNLSGPELAERLGLTRKQAQQASWAIRNPERKRQNSENTRRRCGMRPQAVVNAERHQIALARARKAKAIKDRGFSFSGVGAALGISRNAVAGRLWRARRANQAV